MGAGVGEAHHHQRVVEHLGDHAEVLVQHRPVEDDRAVGGQAQVDVGLDRRGAGPRRGRRGCRRGRSRSGRPVGGQHVELRRAATAGRAPGLLDQRARRTAGRACADPLGTVESASACHAGPVVERGVAVEREDHADAAGGGLGAQPGAGGVGLVDEARAPAVQLGAANVLVRLKVNGRPERPAHGGHQATSVRARSSPGPSPSKRGARSNTPRPWRPSTSASATSSSGSGPGARARCGRRGPGGAGSARSRSPPRRRRMASSTRATIGASSSSVGRRLVEGAVAHGVVAHGAVADEAADVEALGHAAEPARGSRRRSPSPTAAPRGSRRRDVLDRLHHLGQELAWSRAAPGRRSCRSCRCTTEVTPCQHDDVPSGSQPNWASRWVWRSTKPGVTRRPSASIAGAAGADLARPRRCGRRRRRRRPGAPARPCRRPPCPPVITRSCTARGYRPGR